MTKSLGNISGYSEYLVEYDKDNLVVYLSGLDVNNFWDEIEVFDEVDDPESFAQGLVEGLKKVGTFASAVRVIYD